MNNDIAPVAPLTKEELEAICEQAMNEPAGAVPVYDGPAPLTEEEIAHKRLKSFGRPFDLYAEFLKVELERDELRLECDEQAAEIAALKAANEWISVKERLPEVRDTGTTGAGFEGLFDHSELMEIYTPNQERVLAEYWGDGTWIDKNGAYWSATHWRELPAPPEQTP